MTRIAHAGKEAKSNLIERQLKIGRAEFGEAPKTSFERAPASLLLAPAQSGRKVSGERNPVGSNVGMIIGSPGLGKTHLARKFATEKPSVILALDKDALEEGKIVYKRIANAEKPEFMFVDDVHYLLGKMFVSRGTPTEIKEEDVVKVLYAFEKESRDIGARLVLIADEGPGSLSSRFNNPENGDKFLQLVRGCTSTPDDVTIMVARLGEKLTPDELMYFSPNNVANLNRRGFSGYYGGIYVQLEQAFELGPVFENALQYLAGRYGLPEDFGTFPLHKKILVVQEHFEDELWKVNEAVLLTIMENILTELNITDIPYAVSSRSRDEFRRTLSTSQYDAHGRPSNIYDVSPTGRIFSTSTRLRNMGMTYEAEQTNTPIATFRELKVVSEALGGLSPEKLAKYARKGAIEMPKKRIPNGSTTPEIEFRAGDLEVMAEVIHVLYNRIAGDDYSALLSVFRSDASDLEVHKAMVGHRLRKEKP